MTTKGSIITQSAANTIGTDNSKKIIINAVGSDKSIHVDTDAEKATHAQEL